MLSTFFEWFLDNCVAVRPFKIRFILSSSSSQKKYLIFFASDPHNCQSTRSVTDILPVQFEYFITSILNLIFHKTWAKLTIRFFCYVSVFNGNLSEWLGGMVVNQPGRAESVGWNGETIVKDDYSVKWLKNGHF